MSDMDQKLEQDGEHHQAAAEQPAPGVETGAKEGAGTRPTSEAPDQAAGEAHAGGADGVPARKASGADPKRQATGAEDGHPVASANDLAADLDELVSVAAQRDEYLALAQRTQADFENYRKRVSREAAAAQERGVVALAKELLPALDNLDRALEAAAEDDPLLDGVRLVRGELSAALARMGIESFSPVGEPFDPSVHEALATVPRGEDADARGGGVVVEVYQPGYRLGESVIRPARVVVTA
jgi:molecular chaperone GrpE